MKERHIPRPLHTFSAFFLANSRALMRFLSSLRGAGLRQLDLRLSRYLQRLREQSTHLLETISPVSGSFWRLGAAAAAACCLSCGTSGVVTSAILFGGFRGGWE